MMTLEVISYRSLFITFLCICVEFSVSSLTKLLVFSSMGLISFLIITIVIAIVIRDERLQKGMLRICRSNKYLNCGWIILHSFWKKTSFQLVLTLSRWGKDEHPETRGWGHTKRLIFSFTQTRGGFRMARLFVEDSFYFEDYREYNPSIPIANVNFSL